MSWYLISLWLSVGIIRGELEIVGKGVGWVHEGWMDGWVA